MEIRSNYVVIFTLGNPKLTNLICDLFSLLSAN